MIRSRSVAGRAAHVLAVQQRPLPHARPLHSCASTAAAAASGPPRTTPAAPAAASSATSAAAAAPASATGGARVRSPSAPLRLAILGAGISGLTLARQLQRSLREAGVGGVEMHMFESSPRSGGWLRSSSSPAGAVLEKGPRSLMYRKDSSSESTLQLIGQLGLGPQVVSADPAANRRFVWNSAEPGSGKPEGKLVPMPTGLGSLWRFPHRNALLRGFWRELKQPPLVTETEEASDESVMQFMTRRLGSVVAEELVDPMIAGIYAGDPYVLSMQSCLARVAAMERASGGILRDQAFQSKEVRARKAAEFDAQYDEHHAADVERQANPWRAKVMDLANGSGGIYTLEGGLATLVRALRLRLADDSNDPYTVVMRQRGSERDVPDARFVMHAKQAVRALRIDEHNKPVLHVADQQSGGNVEALQFDHAFSTLPTHALHSVLTSPQSSLPLSAEHRSHLAHVLSPQESMPFASVWVVNVVYPRGDILRPEQRGFGLLVPSKHTIRGLEVLGISYDSCIFPPAVEDPLSAAAASAETETRLTVMLGGARHPWLATELDESGASLHALRAIEALMGIDHRVARPTLVEATLQVDCIPQFLVGHAQKQHELHQLLQHLAYTPPSFTLPVVRPLPPLHVDVHEAGVRAAERQANPPLRPLTLLGTNYGVAVNDCIHHATKTAQEFAQRIKEQQQ